MDRSLPNTLRSIANSREARKADGHDRSSGSTCMERPRCLPRHSELMKLSGRQTVNGALRHLETHIRETIGDSIPPFVSSYRYQEILVSFPPDHNVDTYSCATVLPRYVSRMWVNPGYLVSSENRTTEISAGMEVLVIVSTLIVERASPRHAGNYSCEVPGKAKTTIAVHVLNGEYSLISA